MASFKLSPSPNSRNSDLSRGSSSSSSSPASLLNPQFLSNRSTKNYIPIRNRNHSISSMTVDGFLRNGYDSNPTESILLDAQITLVDSPNPMNTSTTAVTNSSAVVDSHRNSSSAAAAPKTVDDVWREIVSGERKELKEEVAEEMMTLEDFLVRTGVVPVEDVKLPQSERLLSGGGIFSFDPIPGGSFQALDKVEGSIVGFGNEVDLIGSGGRRKRGRAAALEPLDKAAEQRQRRMIKNRESAARSRERKQAYQVELESLAVRLEEENERLLREKAERTKERFKQLMEKVIPVVEKRQPPRVIRRVNSMKW